MMRAAAELDFDGERQMEKGWIGFSLRWWGISKGMDFYYPATGLIKL